MAMAGLISPKPLSYLQHAGQFNPYQQQQQQQQQQRLAGSALSGYSDTHTHTQSHTPSLHPHQHIMGLQEESKIYSLVIDLTDPNAREAALLELSKKREQYEELALVLWHSFGEFLVLVLLALIVLCRTLMMWLCWNGTGIMPALLQEIVSVYPLLSPPNLTAHVSNRVCNALALLQCVASHPDTRQLFLNGRFRAWVGLVGFGLTFWFLMTAHIPLFLYPFLNTTSKTRPFEYLRLTSLGVIGALVKVRLFPSLHPLPIFLSRPNSNFKY
jgi:CCR4-NOT transcription complex subunit 9